METKRCIIIGVGGQGNLLMSNLLGQGAVAMGIPVVVSEIHGMAQRGGIVESAVLIGGPSSPIISEGETDILVSFEPMETLRAANKCNQDTLVITNIQPLPPYTVSIDQGVYPPMDEIMEKIRGKISHVITLKGNDLAAEAGNALSLNMVMLGGLIGTGSVPMDAEVMQETIAAHTKKAFLEYNLKAFDLGMAVGKSQAEAMGLI